MLAINEILKDRYRILRQLGKGGMGAVYEAHDNVFDTTVALKEILIDLAKGSTPKQKELLRAAFEREGKILAKVHHEVFPHVRDYFQEGDRQYLIMELVDGDDLAELLEKRGTPFSSAEVLSWTDQLLDALDYLHNLNPPIIHRDIKPQNLKLNSRGRIKLLDFGIAKGDNSKVSTTITNQTFVAATLNYSPLEQIYRVLDPTYREIIAYQFKDKSDEIMEQTADARSDIYALGATLYHLLTNTLPVDALKRSLEVWAGKPDPLINAYALNPQISPELSAVLHKAMTLDHDRRFADANEMRAALSDLSGSAKRREEDAERAAWQEQQKKLEAERAAILEERQRIEAEREKYLSRIEAEKRREAEAQNPATVQNIGGQQTQPSPEFFPATQAFNASPNPLTQQPTEKYSLSQTDSVETITPATNQQFSAQPFAAPQTRKSKSKVLWLAPLLILLFLTLGGGIFGFWLWRNSTPTVKTDANVNADINTNTGKGENINAAPETVAQQGGSAEENDSGANQNSSPQNSTVGKSQPSTTAKTQTTTRSEPKPQPRTIVQQPVSKPTPKTVATTPRQREGAGDSQTRREGAGDKKPKY